jgi:uncharacterized protein (TIGR03382 family)
MNRLNAFLLFMVLVAVPVAIFHYASGRIGNGIMATVAVLVGAAILLAERRAAREEHVA